MLGTNSNPESAMKKGNKKAKTKKAKTQKAKAKKKVTIKDLKPRKTSGKSELDVKGGGGAYGGVVTRLM
jgi:hypothetical protein